MRDNSRKERIAFEQGMIEGWRHIRSICNCCIEAHIEERKRLNKIRKKIEQKYKGVER
jgi:hypothetical protein